MGETLGKEEKGSFRSDSSFPGRRGDLGPRGILASLSQGVWFWSRNGAREVTLQEVSESTGGFNVYGA